MHDSSLQHTRVLEPLDTNSLSMIAPDSEATGSSISSNLKNSSLAFHTSKTSTPPVSSVCGTPLKWQFSQKEFNFNSNSTPSRANNCLAYDDRVKRQRKKKKAARANLSGAKARVKSTLSHTISKLDLLDDQNLTSFPIPPPINDPQQHTPNPVNEFNIRVHAENRRISFNPRSLADSETSAQPIVLVEDYIPQENSGASQASRKRVSISDLKSRVFKRNTSKLPLKLKQNRKLSTDSSLTLIPQLYGGDLADIAMIEEDGEHGDYGSGGCQHENDYEDGYYSEEYMQEAQSRTTSATAATLAAATASPIEYVLGDIIRAREQPASTDQYLSILTIEHKLKHCVICEKPLYELSSLLPRGRDFQEIVCGGCTAKYEETAKILEDYEFETSMESIEQSRCSGSDNDNDSDSGIENDSDFDDAQVIVENRSKRLKTNQFSAQLISRLHLQLQHTPMKAQPPHPVDSKTMLWFLEAKRKLRWRWRVSGLLPQFLAGKRNM